MGTGQRNKYNIIHYIIHSPHPEGTAASGMQDITSKLDKLLVQSNMQPTKQKSDTEGPSQINQLKREICDVRQHMSQLSASEPNYSQQSRPSTRFYMQPSTSGTPRFFNCRKIGHVASLCRQVCTVSPARLPNRQTTSITCYRCQWLGHIARYCRGSSPRMQAGMGYNFGRNLNM